MSSDYYGFLAGEIADTGWPPDHDPTDPGCICDECMVDRDDDDE